MKTALGPILHRDEHTQALDREAQEWLAEAVTEPLENLFADGRENSVDRPSAVATALLAGTLWYHGGVFGGTLNAGISKELRELGARLLPDGTFRLDSWRLTIPLRAAIAVTQGQSERLHADAVATTDTMRANIIKAAIGIGLLLAIRAILSDLSEQTKASVAGKAGLKFEPSMADLLTAEPLAEQFTERLRTYLGLKLAKLKKLVEENRLAGGRPDKLRKIFEEWARQTKRGVSTLSEHEAAKIVTAHRRALAQRLGISEYVWRTMRDSRVRKCHWVLEGTTQNWENPPVIDDRTGLRGGPGEAANCRCVPILLLVHAESAAA